mgnify:FL=1
MDTGLGEFDDLLHQEVAEVSPGFTDTLLNRLDNERIEPRAKPNGIAIAATLIVLLNLVAGLVYLTQSSTNTTETNSAEVSDPYFSTSGGYEY